MQNTVIFLRFRTDRSGQTVQTQIRLLLEEQSDQGLHCLDQTAPRGAVWSGSTLFAIPPASFGWITLRKRHLVQLLGWLQQILWVSEYLFVALKLCFCFWIWCTKALLCVYFWIWCTKALLSVCLFLDLVHQSAPVCLSISGFGAPKRSCLCVYFWIWCTKALLSVCLFLDLVQQSTPVCVSVSELDRRK